MEDGKFYVQILREKCCPTEDLDESKEDDAGENDFCVAGGSDYDVNDNIKINSYFNSHWLGFAASMLGIKVKEYMYSLKSWFNRDLPCYMVQKKSPSTNPGWIVAITWAVAPSNSDHLRSLHVW